jgi:hypothetical protein
MSYKTIDTYVEVEVDLSEWSDQELLEELRSRKAEISNEGTLQREDWQFLLEMLDNLPGDIYTRSVREKVFAARNNSLTF